MVVIDASASPARSTASGSIGVEIPEFGILFDALFRADPVPARTNATQATLYNLTGYGRSDQITYYGTIPPLPADIVGRISWRIALDAMSFDHAVIETVFGNVSPDPQVVEITLPAPQRADWFGNDFYTILAGNDLLIGSAFADTLGGGNGNDTLRGAGGRDRLEGGSGMDLLQGGVGGDTLDGGFDADTIQGGGGNDRISGGSGADRASGQKGNDRIDGGTENDTLFGGTGNDTIDGSTGNDRIKGDAGNDLLSGGSGGDTLIGGVGNDTLWNQHSDDTGLYAPQDDLMIGGPGQDSFMVSLSFLSEGVRDNPFPVEPGDLTMTVRGGAGSDHLQVIAPKGIGTPQGAGFLIDGDGDTASLVVGYGTPAASAAAGIALSSVETIVLPVLGTSGFAFSYAMDSDTTVSFRSKWGAPVMSSADGPSVVLQPVTGPTASPLVVLATGRGDDLVKLAGFDAAKGYAVGTGAGKDTLRGAASDDLLEGGTGQDLISGGAGNDSISGGGAKDRIYGGPGDDVMADGNGVDRLTGGPGADVFGLEDDNTRDIVMDFDPGQGDSLRIEGLTDFDALAITDLAGGGVQVRFAGDTLILRDPGDAFDAGDAVADWFGL